MGYPCVIAQSSCFIRHFLLTMWVSFSWFLFLIPHNWIGEFSGPPEPPGCYSMVFRRVGGIHIRLAHSMQRRRQMLDCFQNGYRPVVLWGGKRLQSWAQFICFKIRNLGTSFSVGTNDFIISDSRINILLSSDPYCNTWYCSLKMRGFKLINLQCSTVWTSCSTHVK